VLKLWSRSGTAGSAQPGEETAARNNVSGVWWWVMLLLTIAALAESVVASRYLGTQREQP
jgi:hypothetical protein